MAVNEAHFRQLLNKYTNHLASPEEVKELFALIKEGDYDDAFHRLIVEVLENTDPALADEKSWDRHFDDLLVKAKDRELDGESPVKHLPLIWSRLAIALCAILIVSIGGYLVLHQNKPQQQVAQNQLHDVAPGRSQATLTLANGQKIVLTKGLKGTLAQQGKTLINVNKGNAIAYSNTGGSDEPVQYNTLTTVRGEQSPYPLILADGTKVWLNAASSITFPTSFKGAERTVKITGEAYFEVAHNALQPFSVVANGETVQDIGTAFNINAYTDEPALVTTLVHGSIRVVKAQNSKTLSPGQQSLIAAGRDHIRVQQANLEEALAWKNGQFVFNDETLESIMRKVSRWYDVDVIYQDIDKDKLYWGSMSRDNNVSEVLKNLELTGEVHFKIEGRRLIVTK